MYKLKYQFKKKKKFIVLAKTPIHAGIGWYSQNRLVQHGIFLKTY